MEPSWLGLCAVARSLAAWATFAYDMVGGGAGVGFTDVEEAMRAFAAAPIGKR